jgi:hypothetical protein
MDEENADTTNTTTARPEDARSLILPPVRIRLYPQNETIPAEMIILLAPCHSTPSANHMAAPERREHQ